MRSLADLVGISKVRLPFEPSCPEIPPGREPVFLLDASTGLEETLLQTWVERCYPARARTLRLSPSRIRRPSRTTDPELAGVLSGGDRWWLVPLRVVWMPSERHGRRTVSWVDLLKLGDPRDPRWFRDYLILAIAPDRVRIVVGDGAGPEEMVDAHQKADTPPPLIDFVARRAHLVLDRAERTERGNRYKIPRFLAEDILDSPHFTSEARRLGDERGLSPSRAVRRARYYLREIAASHSAYLIDLIANLIHWVIRQGYGGIHYDPGQLEEIARLGSDHPLVFLPSHKSNLDRLSLQFILWENDLPPNHTAGGINMNFFPVGPLVRRTGVFFIRRTFRGNDLYKFVLRTYIDYLIERRFPLEWYMEGGRSRTGKLRPPRFGLLSWVVDSWRRGKTDEIYLLPISIAYDQIQEIGAYVNEATGGTKEKESFSWALRFARNLRRRYGDIHIRFAEPISVSRNLGSGDDAVQRLGLEVMYRIGLATPVTPTALVATVLLDARGEARDAAAIARSAAVLADYIDRRGIPTTVARLPTDPDTVVATLSLMEDHRLVSSLTARDRTVWWMEREEKLRASYYSNSVIHHFIPRGLAEIALAAPDIDGFWADLLDLRDLFKFEFFFAGSDRFPQEVANELTAEHPDWESEVAAGRGDQVILEPSVVGFAIAPLLEAYMVVADELAAMEGEFDKGAVVAACLERGRLYRLEGRTESDESVSASIYEGALLLAENRGIIEGPNATAERQRLAEQVRRYLATARVRSSRASGIHSSP